MVSPGPERVVLLVREGCHLCVDAIEIVDQVCAGLGVAWRSVDVDSDPDLKARYSDHVPVTLVDGHEHARWFVDAKKLAAALDPTA